MPTVEPRPELERVVVTAEYALGVYGPALIQIWEHSTPEVGAQQTVDLARMLGQSQHKRVGTLSVIGDRSALPSSEARRIFAAMPKAFDCDAGCALVREGQGFRPAAVRAVLTSMSILAGGGYPYEVFGDVPSAAHWLCRRLDDAVDVDSLTAAVQTLRSQVGGTSRRD